MGIKKIVDMWFVFKGIQHHKKKLTFTKEMLISWIGEFWYNQFYDENDNLKYSFDKIYATAREVGKTYVAVVVIIYEMINDPYANFVLTRKYGSAAGSFYEMFNQVLNDFQDKFKVRFEIKYQVENKTTYKKKDKKYLLDEEGNKIPNKPTYKTLKEINRLKGRGDALFSYGKTGDDKIAIFFNYNYDITQNQICFLRGADDADGSRGLSVNRGYIKAIILEEYSQEVDQGKLDPEVQITRYKSLHKSSNRYSVKMASMGGANKDLRTANWALANIWDREHPYNIALINAIPEEEYREHVLADLDNNTHIVVEKDGITYLRATSLFNEFLYPKGSEQRAALIEEIKKYVEQNDDYKLAELLGFTFPGFLKLDNPIGDIIQMIMNAPEMTREELAAAGYETDLVEFGADPGLRDDAFTTPCELVSNIKLQDYDNKKRMLYFDKYLHIPNRDNLKKKLPRIPNPTMKKMFLKFWLERMEEIFGDDHEEFLTVNMDMRALAIKDDFNYEIFPNNDIKGKCSWIPSTEGKGFGLEQRPDMATQMLSKAIFHPITKYFLINAFKTLEIYKEDKKQPHPRKGMVDIWDGWCYSWAKLKGHTR